MDATRFIDEFRPFRRGELALARGVSEGTVKLPASDLHTLRYALRLAQLSAISDERDDLVERLAWYRLALLQALAPVLPTGPGEIDEDSLRAVLREVVSITSRARRELIDGGLTSAEALNRTIASKQLVLVMGGAGGSGYVYLGVLSRLAELGLTPSYIVGCSIGAILAVLRGREERFDLEALFEEIRLLRAVAALGAPARARFGLPGAVRIDLHRALAPLFTHPDGSPVRLADLSVPVDALTTGLGATALGMPREAYGELLAVEDRNADALSQLSGSTLARAMGALVSMAMSRRVLVPILLGAEPETDGLPALDAAGFSAAIPGLLQYELPADDRVAAGILERLFERAQIGALVDGLVSSAVPAHWAWERLEAGHIGTRNYVIVALHALEAAQRGAGALLTPLQRAFAGTAHRDKPFWDVRVRFQRGPGIFDLLPPQPTLRAATQSGSEEFEGTAKLLECLLAPLPAWTG